MEWFKTYVQAREIGLISEFVVFNIEMKLRDILMINEGTVYFAVPSLLKVGRDEENGKEI